jgi:multiple sugar transport system substrate-binding protein
MRGSLGRGSPQLSDSSDLEQTLAFIEAFSIERNAILEPSAPDPFLNMAVFLMRCHLEGKTVTPSALVANAGVPYATGVRKMNELVDAGLIERRPRTRSSKTFSLHPSASMIEAWRTLSTRTRALAARIFEGAPAEVQSSEYFYGGTYMSGQAMSPPQVLSEPLKLPGGLNILVHSDPTFMAMGSLKRHFENLVGSEIKQRAFSIDRLHDEAINNARRETSRYDIIAVDLPWIGEFAERDVLLALDEVMDLERLQPRDFHPSGWEASLWQGRSYGVPSQTTPELLFYRRDAFEAANLTPPQTTDQVLEAAATLNEPSQGRYGIGWNAARGTPLGHTFMFTCADFHQPILDLDPLGDGFDTQTIGTRALRPQFDSPGALLAAEYLLELLRYSPPEVLSMSWYERVRDYAKGRVAMAYSYTLLAPYFELDETAPAHGTTGYLPHPSGWGGQPIAPIGGYILGIPKNLPAARQRAVADALTLFTSPGAQKLYIENGSRTAPRFSVGADPEVDRTSPIFQAVNAMSGSGQLQGWPRPGIPQIADLTALCGTHLHEMLRGTMTAKEALAAIQKKAEALMTNTE